MVTLCPSSARLCASEVSAVPMPPFVLGPITSRVTKRTRSLCFLLAQPVRSPPTALPANSSLMLASLRDMNSILSPSMSDDASLETAATPLHHVCHCCAVFRGAGCGGSPPVARITRQARVIHRCMGIPSPLPRCVVIGVHVAGTAAQVPPAAAAGAAAAAGDAAGIFRWTSYRTARGCSSRHEGARETGKNNSGERGRGRGREGGRERCTCSASSAGGRTPCSR